MTTFLFWATVILCLGLFLLFAELFIPSGGVLGVLSGLALIASIVLAFNHSVYAGFFYLLIVLVALPVSVGLGMTMWPHTYFGRKMTLELPAAEDLETATEMDRELHALIGQRGRTLTQLRPAGLTEISGRRVDTLSEGVIVEANRPVRVVAVHGRSVVVREIDSNGSGDLS